MVNLSRAVTRRRAGIGAPRTIALRNLGPTIRAINAQQVTRAMMNVSAPAKPPMSTGMKLAIGAVAVVVVGGAAYFLTR